MARRYSAFVLRRWRQDDGRERVELQEVATGERRRFPTLAAACAWLTERDHAPPDAPPRRHARAPAAANEPP